jgi:hypothetical protein
MIKRILLFGLVLVINAVPTFAQDTLKASHKLSAWFDMVYNPIGSVKMPSSNSRLTFYDNIAFRLAGEYFVSDYVSIGPGFEYLSKRVSPDATFSSDIKLAGLFLDSRFNYPLTDSGNSFLVIGLGTGIVHLSEASGSGNNGPSFYTIAGLDIGLRPHLGLDLLYRYGFTRVDITNIREYRFTGWALQTGISYRFKF